MSKKESPQNSKNEYFDYLTEQKIKKVISESIGRYKLFGRIIVILVATIVAFAGVDYYQIKNSFDETEIKLTSKVNSFEKRVKTLDSLEHALRKNMDFQEKQTEILLGYLDLLDKSIDKSGDNLDKYMDYIQNRIKYLNDFETRQRQALNETEELNNIVEENLELSNILFDEINNEKTELLNLYSNMEFRTRKIERNASVRYVHIARSDRFENQNEYKPVEVNLFKTNSKLKFVFFEKKKKGNVNFLSLDVYINDQLIPYNPITFEELNQSFTPAYLPIDVDGNKYSIEPIFFYKPPNPFMVYVIPDYIILKVSLLSIPDWEANTE